LLGHYILLSGVVTATVRSLNVKIMLAQSREGI
jgi:hypothetical protein